MRTTITEMDIELKRKVVEINISKIDLCILNDGYLHDAI